VTVYEGVTVRASATASFVGTWSATIGGVSDGSHSYTSTATASGGATSPASAIRTVRVDTRAPAAPVFTAPADNSVQTSSSVTVSGTAEAGALVEVLEGMTLRGSTTATGTGAWTVSLTGVTAGAHTYTAHATDLAGNRSPATGPRSVTVDPVAPNTAVISGPSSLTSSRTATFGFAADESGVTFRCRLDGPGSSAGSYFVCASPETFSSLADGAYTFRVYATDQAGNTDTTPATHAFTVDGTAPSAPTFSSPAENAWVNSSSVPLAGSAEPGLTVVVTEGSTVRGSTVATAGGAWSLVVTGASDGSHGYGARATDAAGNTSSASATRTVRIDTQAPDTSISSGPSGSQTATSASFTFAATEPGSTLECRLDGPGSASGAWASCTSPRSYSSLALGSYTFRARARDAAGNLDTTDATRAFSVTAAPTPTPTPTPTATATPDVTPPSVPKGLHTSARTETTVTLTWNPSTDNVGVVGYRVYNGTTTNLRATTTEPTHTVTGLVCGTNYQFGITAVDAAGNESYRPEAIAGTYTSTCASTPTPTPTPTATPDTTPPSVPQGLVTTDRSETAVTLEWNASTDDTGVTGYRIYDDDADVLLGTTSETTYTVTGLNCGTDYGIGVAAVDAAENESYRPASVASTSTASCSDPSPTPTATPTASPPPAPDPGGEPLTEANLWVDTSGGACVRSSTRAGYADAAACATFDAAWKAAAMGDVVGIRAGTYGGQTMSNRPVRGTSPGVTFRAVGGTVVVNGAMKVGEDSAFGGPGKRPADWITLIGPFTFASLSFANTTNITVDGFVVDKKWNTGKAVFFGGNTDRTTLRHADICCNYDTPLMESTVPGPASAGYGPNSNITFADAKIHDMRRSASNVHNECFLAPATPGLTLTRTHWYGCNVMNINIGAFGDSRPYSQDNYTWINNIFESPTNRNENDKTGYPFFQGCNYANPANKTGWVVAYNIMETSWYACSGENGLVLRGNVGKLGSVCLKGDVTYEYNVWSDRSCGGSTDRVRAGLFSSTNFTDIAAHDWTYRPGAYQIDRGDPTNHPDTDITGRGRPVGAAPDAGPYEYGN
jgi:chitodextrinase